MASSRTPSIRAHLILLVLACVLPATVMIVAWTVYDYEKARGRILDELIARTRAIVAAIDREFAGTQAALSALATSPHLTAENWHAFHAQAQMVQRNLNVVNILVFDTSYQQRLNTLRPAGSALPVDRNPVVQRAFATGLPGVSDIFLAPVLRSPLIGIVVPVFRDGAARYVLAASFSPERLSDLLQKHRPPRDWISAIFDSTGTIVARTHRMAQYVGTMGTPALVERMKQVSEGTLDVITVEGIPTTAVFTRSSISNWTVAIGIPSKDIAEELAQRLWWLVAGTAMLLLASLALAWLIGGRIANSIRALAAPALALGSGEAVTVPALQLKEAEEVGSALTRASAMLRAAQHKANHDALTGLANRALFNEILAHQLAICHRTQRDLAILFIDLDGFKAVNDVHGHATGDDVLRMVATRLTHAVRASDMVARLGGDEFGVVLIDARLAGAQAVAAKVIDSLSLPYAIGSIALEISASVGIAERPESGTTGEELLLRADEALYEAKAAGKRRYAVAG